MYGQGLFTSNLMNLFVFFLRLLQLLVTKNKTICLRLVGVLTVLGSSRLTYIKYLCIDGIKCVKKGKQMQNIVKTQEVSIFSLNNTNLSAQPEIVLPTVSLKGAFGQKDVPHHKNTARTVRNFST